jgi:hypothetical protein
VTLVGVLDGAPDLRAGQMRHHQLTGVAMKLDSPPANFEPQSVRRPGRRAALGPVLAVSGTFSGTFSAPATVTATPATVTTTPATVTPTLATVTPTPATVTTTLATVTPTPALTRASTPLATGTAAASTPLTAGTAPALAAPALTTRTRTPTT